MKIRSAGASSAIRPSVFKTGLTDELGYTGSYDTVQKYVKTIRIKAEEKGTQELRLGSGLCAGGLGEADLTKDTEPVRRTLVRSLRR